MDSVRVCTKEKPEFNHSRNLSLQDLSSFAGADVFLHVEVSPFSTVFRPNSIIYQKLVNDIIRTITEGAVYDRFTELTDEEKVSGLEVLPVGTLVRIKNTITVGIILDYNYDSRKYIVNSALEDGVVRSKTSSGDLCYNKYKDSGMRLGNYKRYEIIPFNPMTENSWYEGRPKEEKKELSDEDINGQQGGSENQPTGDEKKNPRERDPKIFNIGDIVYVRTIGKFGKIVSMSDGKFELEEVEEDNARIIDDSLWH